MIGRYITKRQFYLRETGGCGGCGGSRRLGWDCRCGIGGRGNRLRRTWGYFYGSRFTPGFGYLSLCRSAESAHQGNGDRHPSAKMSESIHGNYQALVAKKRWLQKGVKCGYDLNNTYTNLWMAVPWEQFFGYIALKNLMDKPTYTLPLHVPIRVL